MRRRRYAKKQYREKIAVFKEYSNQFPDKDLYDLYNEWAESQDIYGIERHEIWVHIRKLLPKKTVIIKEGSEEWIRVRAVLDILLEADLAYLNKLIEKREKKK